MNNLICVAGSSGVGKTTVSRLLSLIFPAGRSTTVCGDNYHKWERGDPNWKTCTHLNPKANNLDDAFRDMRALKEGKTAEIPYYNHDTGLIEPPTLVNPNDTIIYEGLHALGLTSEIGDVNIFVDTEEELKINWKIARDTSDRGHTPTEALAMIKARKGDEETFISPQEYKANILVRFYSQNGRVIIRAEAMTEEYAWLAAELNAAYAQLISFVGVCNKLGTGGEEFSAHRGGNVSFKYGDKLVITESGAKLSDVTTIKNYWMTGDSTGEPSMEKEMHKNIPEPIVIHVHPYYVNALLCSEGGLGTIEELFLESQGRGGTFHNIKYFTPGQELAAAIKDYSLPTGNKILFLENHGVVSCSSSWDGAVYQVRQSVQACRYWVNSRRSYSPSAGTYEPVYPDAALFEEDRVINNKLVQTMQTVGLIPKYLPEGEIEKVKNMKEERYRSSLV